MPLPVPWGGEEGLPVDCPIQELRDGNGGIYVICSDGLTKELGPDELTAIPAHADIEQAARSLIERAGERGAPDKVAAAAVRIEWGKP
jgi:serine/threonine protein phosphatase PrpC